LVLLVKMGNLNPYYNESFVFIVEQEQLRVCTYKTFYEPGGVSYALYILVLISKLFCTNTLCTAGRGAIHYKGLWKGWTLKIKTLLSSEMTTHVHKITNVHGFFYRTWT
jgi:hypothetical protein